ncbi:hypothetical protein GCM10023176_57400 [Micromonospora coerulea]|uniref:Uncharacterized protein n=1 Tax=Micromonospora coerulea TaxID=47856 RepID=A0ABP8T147_9ACTN
MYFQFGALGGVSAGEYHDSGDRIADYLQREGSPYQRWTPPGPYRAAWSSTSWLPARSP